mmetsp:Transcript_11274/g.17252  ORF Transcript_11274/g.17252 Transcript_11274/m.17252 type:complete len:96 (-) Transcript_11274:394-681(-)
MHFCKNKGFISNTKELASTKLFEHAVDYYYPPLDECVLGESSPLIHNEASGHPLQPSSNPILLQQTPKHFDERFAEVPFSNSTFVLVYDRSIRHA